ncbi:MAG: hypothetical protein IJB94_07595 [Clostridia bacterium]|nr:hypothetical protein [Clostridia bacterium]
MKKLLILLLIAAMLLPAILSGCNNTPPETTTPTETTSEVTTPSVGDGPDTPDITADNVLRRAEIFTGESESEVLAGKELAK